MRFKKIKSKADVAKSDKCSGYLIDADEKTARSIITSLGKTDKKVALVGGDDAFNRRAVETLKIDYLVSPERGDKKDSLKQRDSGINHIVAKLAKEKGVAIVVDIDEVKKLKVAARGIPSELGTSDEVPPLSGKEMALRLGRIIQNVKVCRKAGCKIKIWGGDDERGLKSIGISLGMNSAQSSDAVVL